MLVALKGRPAPGVLKQERMVKAPNQQGQEPTREGGGTARIRDGPAQVEVAVAGMLSWTDNVRVIEVERWSEGALGGDPSAAQQILPGRCDICPPGPLTLWTQGPMRWGFLAIPEGCPAY
jgi:hypothetical protein